MKQTTILVLLSIALCSCASATKHRITDWSRIDAGPKPELAEIKSAIENHINALMSDPQSTRFSGWTAPYKDLKSWSTNEPIVGVWSLCVDVDSKGPSGNYLGKETYWAILRDGQVVEIRSPGEYGSSKSREISAWRRKICEEGAALGNSPPLLK